MAWSLDSVDSSSFGPAKLTSSREDVDRRWAVRSGDFFCCRGVSSSSGGGDGTGSPISESISLLGTGGDMGGRGGWSVARGVVAEPFDGRRSVSERAAVEDMGRGDFTGAVSSASSKVS